MRANIKQFDLQDKGTFAILSKKEQQALSEGEVVVAPLPSILFSSDEPNGELHNEIVVHLHNHLRNSIN